MYVETLAKCLGHSRCSLNDKTIKTKAANSKKELLRGKGDPTIMRRI